MLSSQQSKKNDLEFSKIFGHQKRNQRVMILAMNISCSTFQAYKSDCYVFDEVKEMELKKVQEIFNYLNFY